MLKNLFIILLLLLTLIDAKESGIDLIQEELDFVISEDKDTSYLSICDNGGGINEEKIDRIFDPYFTTKFADEGVGLGLYMAKMLIEDSMHGKLEAANKNGGVCFEISIPKEVTDV